MAWYTFGTVPAVDAMTGKLLPGAEVEFFDMADTTYSSPLEVKTLDEQRVTRLRSSETGQFTFSAEDRTELRFRTVGGSVYGVVQTTAAVDAKASHALEVAQQAQADVDAMGVAAPVLPAGGSPGDVLYRDAAERTGVWGPAGSGGGTGVSSWEALADKPATFPPSEHTHTPGQVGASSVGQQVMTAQSALAARQAIGAGTGNGTSDLQLGSTATTAAPGNHAHTAGQVAFAPSGAITATTVQAAIVQAAQTGSGGGSVSPVLVWRYTGGAYPALAVSKPAGVQVVQAIGPSQPTTLPGWVGNAADQVPVSYDYAPVA